MNRKVIINGILAILSLTAIGLSLGSTLKAPKIAYVNTYQLLDKYEGMKEAQGLYRGKVISWQKKIDSLKNQLAYEIQTYQQDSGKLLSKEKEKLRKKIENDKILYQEWDQKVSEISSTEQQNLSEGLINQINRYVEKYGEENGYDIILSSSETGTIIYRRDAIDITDKVLQGLNKEFKGK